MSIYIIEKSKDGLDWEPIQLQEGVVAAFEYKSVADGTARQNSSAPVHTDTKFRVREYQPC